MDPDIAKLPDAQSERGKIVKKPPLPFLNILHKQQVIRIKLSIFTFLYTMAGSAVKARGGGAPPLFRAIFSGIFGVLY